MPIDIWYIWYINVRRGARVDICVIIYDCVNKGDGENFQVVKNVFRPCFGKHSWRCFCFNTFVLRDDFQAERKENMWSSFSLEMRNTLPRVVTEKIFKHLTDNELFYCKLEKVIRFADSSLLVLFVSLSSAPFFSFPFFL